MGGKKTLNTLPHRVKREICTHKQKNPGLTNRDLVAWVVETFDEKVHETTISRLLKRSYALLSNVTANDVRRSKNPLCPALEEALYRWFLTAREGRLAMSDALIMEQAKAMFKIMLEEYPDMPDCKFSSGWLTGFKKRHSISLRLLHEEASKAQREP